MHSNLYLDVKNASHFEGRYINDARNSKFSVNARFAANYAANTCSKTGFRWVKIFTTKNIKTGSEIFLNYGDEFWNAYNSDSIQPKSQSSKSELWAEPAPYDSFMEGNRTERPSPPSSHNTSKHINHNNTPNKPYHSYSSSAHKGSLSHTLHTLTLSPIMPINSPSHITYMNDSLPLNHPLTILNNTLVFQS